MPWSWVDTEYSIPRVQHTPSTAYTEYSIHWVQHTPSTASTQDCLSSLHSHDYELTPECSFSFRRASLHDRTLSASSPWELKGKVTWSHSHVCESTNWWIESQHPGAPSIDRLQVLVQSRTITASKVYHQTRSITASKFARSWPPKCISKPARSRPPIVSPNSLDCGLQVHLQTRSITASKCISEVTRSSFSGATRIALKHRLQPVQIYRV